MFRGFCLSFCKFVPVLPGIAAALFALREAANRAGFEKQFPASHEKLVSYVNYLVYILIEHIIGYVIFCALAAFIWTLIVMEPKTTSKRNFDKRRLKLRS
jgi:hypothetical protein